MKRSEIRGMSGAICITLRAPGLRLLSTYPYHHRAKMSTPSAGGVMIAIPIAINTNFTAHPPASIASLPLRIIWDRPFPIETCGSAMACPYMTNLPGTHAARTAISAHTSPRAIAKKRRVFSYEKLAAEFSLQRWVAPVLYGSHSLTPAASGRALFVVNFRVFR
jgi:hypothetical protein